MCTLSDRYVALRACLCDGKMADLLEKAIDTDPELNGTDYPTEEQFDKMADHARQILFDNVLNKSLEP